jgi:hypothetical protein
LSPTGSCVLDNTRISSTLEVRRMKKNAIYNLFKYAAVAGNVLFVLWMLSNGIDEGFKGTIYQILSYIGLTLLLTLNTVLLLQKDKTSG